MITNIFKLTLFFFLFLPTFNMPSSGLESKEFNKPLLIAEQRTVLKGTISESTKGQETGIGVIGIRFIHQTGFPTYIEEVYPNSPAAKKGIIKTDLIVAVDGISTTKLNPDAVYQLLAGNPGSNVEITIKRNSSTFTVRLVREDLVNFSEHIQQRYLTGPIAVPFDFKELFPFH